MSSSSSHRLLVPFFGLGLSIFCFGVVLATFFVFRRLTHHNQIIDLERRLSDASSRKRSSYASSHNSDVSFYEDVVHYHPRGCGGGRGIFVPRGAPATLSEKEGSGVEVKRPFSTAFLGPFALTSDVTEDAQRVVTTERFPSKSADVEKQEVQTSEASPPSWPRIHRPLSTITETTPGTSWTSITMDDQRPGAGGGNWSSWQGPGQGSEVMSTAYGRRVLQSVASPPMSARSV
jgi:hypothetical protein